MLECKGVVRNIGKAPEGSEWVIKFAKGIPYVADTKGQVKRWCMSVFQQSDQGSEADSLRPPMQIDINKVTDEDSDTETPKSKSGTNAGPPPAVPASGAVPIQDGRSGQGAAAVAGTPRAGVKTLSGSTPGKFSANATILPRVNNSLITK